MAGGYLFGWDPDAEDWVKVVCNPSGELDIDATAIFEDVPVDGELEKGPTSNWAFDHKADVAAHHAKYTDVESRAAINNILDSNGWLTGGLRSRYNYIDQVNFLQIQVAASDDKIRKLTSLTDNSDLMLLTQQIGVGYLNAEFKTYQTNHYSYFIHEDRFQAEIALYLEEAPTDGVVNKAPTSNWAFDHDADAAAHHAKYTDLEAQQACNLDGNLYWSCAGINFGALSPDTDDVILGINGIITIVTNDISITAPVFLPNGSTVTNVIVWGNAGAEDNNWTLYRLTLSDKTLISMATAAVNTADSTITNPVIDNSLYGYFLLVYSVETDDEIYGASITYTL